MTNFTKKRFSVSAPISESYAKNYEATFRRNAEANPSDEALVRASLPLQARAVTQPPTDGFGVPRRITISRAELERWHAVLRSVTRGPVGVVAGLTLGVVREAMKLVLEADDLDPDKK